jgi:hypothetical protein
MSDKRVESSKKGTKIEIRCRDIKTRQDFKSIAAYFDDYEEVIKWLTKNYEMFSKMAPPEDHHVVRGNIL